MRLQTICVPVFFLIIYFEIDSWSDDDILRGSAFLSTPLCAQTTEVQVPVFLIHFSSSPPSHLLQQRNAPLLLFWFLSEQQYFLLHRLLGYPKPLLHFLQHRALGDKMCNCLLHRSTQSKIHRFTSKTLPPIQHQSICFTLEQDDCSKSIQYISTSRILILFLYSCSVILLSTSLLHLSPSNLFADPPISSALIVFRYERFIPNTRRRTVRKKYTAPRSMHCLHNASESCQ